MSQNPVRALLNFALQVHQEELQRAGGADGGGRRPWLPEWGSAFQQRERELNDLYAAALREADRTGFPIPEVERRLRNLQTHILAILLWPRDAPPLSSEDLQSREASGSWSGGLVADYLDEHTGRMMDAWREVESLALRLEPGPDGATVAVSPSATPLLDAVRLPDSARPGNASPPANDRRRSHARSSAPRPQNMDVLAFMVSWQRALQTGANPHGPPEYYPLPEQGDTDNDRAALKLLWACCNNDYWGAEKILLAFRNSPQEYQFPILESMKAIVGAAKLAAFHAAFPVADRPDGSPTATHKKAQPDQRGPREEWRNSAGDLYDPQVAIWSVEDFLRLEKLYKEAGQPFNPALEAGSPAALHVLARHRRQGQESSSANKVDVGIVVALEEEFRELMGQLAAIPRPVLDEETGRSFYLFERASSDPKQPYRCVATFIGEMGHPKAALVTEKLVTSWAPATVAMLGIAGGIDKDVSVGDAVVAAVVDSYAERTKAVAGKRRRGFNLEFAGEVYRCSPDLINKLRHFEFSNPEAHQRWLKSCSEHLESLIPEGQRTPLVAGKLLRPTAAVKVGHLASGPIVGAAQPFIDWLKKRDRSYLALEMEAGGLMAAVSEKADARRTLILRGISDYADERKADLDKLGDGALRHYAMRNVIRLLWALLESDTLPRNKQ